MNMNRVFNKEAEIQLLGSIFKDNDQICEVIEEIRWEDFYIERHKLIYKNMVELYKNSIPVEVVTLAEKLGTSLASVGGVTYLSEISACAASARNIKAYAQILKEKSNMRKIFTILRAALKEAEEKETSAKVIGEKVGEMLLQIRDAEIKEDGEVKQLFDNLVAVLEKRERGEDDLGVETGFKSLDAYLGGFQKEDLVILAARPSMGKSTVAMNLALKAAMMKKAKVAFFNLEMGKQQLLERAISMSVSVPMMDLKKGTIGQEEWKKIKNFKSNFPYKRLKVYDKIFTLTGIRGECKKLKVKEGLDIVFIDYLQLIQGEEKAENRVQEVSKITRRLKLLAKELEVTVIALAQLSRGPEARMEHRPMLSDLRESGSIEQDADIVMFLYRDEYYNKDSEERGILECILAKHRNGEVGTVRFKWLPQVQQIQG